MTKPKKNKQVVKLDEETIAMQQDIEQDVYFIMKPKREFTFKCRVIKQRLTKPTKRKGE